MIRKESEGQCMRLYFEDAEGRRLAIDTAGERYCSNFENGAGKLPDGKRYIWVESGKDLPETTPDQEAEIAEEVRKEVNYRFGTEPGEKRQGEEGENGPDEDQNQVFQ